MSGHSADDGAVTTEKVAHQPRGSAVAPSAPTERTEEALALPFVKGEEVWYVTSGGHVRRVCILSGATDSPMATPASGASAGVTHHTGTGLKEAGGVDRPATQLYMVRYAHGAPAPFQAGASHLFRAPPTGAELSELERLKRDAAEKPRGVLEAEKLERSRLRRLERLRLLQEQTATNWTLWHPLCRPPTAHRLLMPPAGDEDIPDDALQYGHYLGMVFPEDGPFLWIAEEVPAFQSPGPCTDSFRCPSETGLFRCPPARPLMATLDKLTSPSPCAGVHFLRVWTPHSRTRGPYSVTLRACPTFTTHTLPLPHGSTRQMRYIATCTMRTSTAGREAQTPMVAALTLRC